MLLSKLGLETKKIDHRVNGHMLYYDDEFDKSEANYVKRQGIMYVNLGNVIINASL